MKYFKFLRLIVLINHKIKKSLELRGYNNYTFENPISCQNSFITNVNGYETITLFSVIIKKKLRKVCTTILNLMVKIKI